MPYKIDPKNKKCVVKADSGKRVGCTKGSVKKYLAALDVNVNESTVGKYDFLKNNDLIGFTIKADDTVMTITKISNYTSKDRIITITSENPFYNSEDIGSEKMFNADILESDLINTLNSGKWVIDTNEDPFEQLNESEESEIFKEITHKDLEVGMRVVVNGDADPWGTDGGNIKFNNELGKVVYNWNEDEEDTSNAFTIAFDNWDKGHDGGTLTDVCGVNKCWSFFDECAYSEEDGCENISELQFYTINSYDLFDQLNESKDDDFDWVEDIASEGINIGDFYKINLEYPIVAKVEDIFFDNSKVINSDNSGYVVKVRYFNDNEEEEWADYLEEINLDWMYDLINDDDHHWVKVTKEYAENMFKDYQYFKSPMGWVKKYDKNINESEEWYDDLLKENPLIRFDDLKVCDIISLLKTNTFSNLNSEFNSLIQDDIYYHIDSFKEATTHRNGYAEKETVAVCSLMKENPDTGNYYGISRETIDLVRGNNKPIWTLIYREGVMESISESEWFEDVVNEPIMLKVEELEMGDIVIPTCVKEGEYIVISKGTSVRLLDAPTHWATLKRNVKTNTGGVYFEHDTETGKNCRFKLVYRENGIIEESEEFNWVEDILSTSPLEFIGKEMMIDVSDLDDDEKIRLLDILEPHIDRDLDGSNSDGDWGWDCLIKNKKTKSLSLHCGIENNEFEPQKGRVCCLSYKFGDEKEQNPESIVPISGKDLLGLDTNQQTNMNESEEEFNWVEDIIGNAEEIDITKKIDVWRSKLVEGSVIRIHGAWEGMEFSSDLATIVDVPDSAGSYLLKFDRVITEFETNQEGNHTHCGENEIQNIKCECQRKKHGDEVGKCWWTHLESMEEVLYYPFEGKQITESEEDEFSWTEDLLNFNNPINITDKLDVMEELPVGSILQVKGYQDDMEFDMEEVKLVDKAEDKDFDSTYYLFKLKYELGTDNEMTHCGNSQKNNKICECRDENENDEISQSEIGKCWWIELKKQDKVIYYPNRIDLSENKTKKPLLTEGRYDAITRKTVRDIMKVFTDGDANSYNLPLDITGEYEYEQEGLAFSVELDIVRDESVDTFKVATAIADDEENVIMLTIILGHDFNKTELEKLFYKLQEDIIHEIEHFTQIGTNRIEDRPIYKGNTANLKTTYGHHKNVLEIPALVRGFYRRAKLEKRPLDEIMIEDLDYEIERGNLTKYAAKKLLTLWVDYAKKHLPKAIYSN